MTHTFCLDAANRQRTIAQLKARGMDHIAVLFEALDHGAAFMQVPRNKEPIVLPKRRRSGFVIVLGDDYLTAEGPAAFHLATLRRVVRKADAWAVMSGAPVTSVYADAAAKAKRGALVILVETRVEEERSWTDYLHRHGRPNAAKLLVTPNARKRTA
jgi:hypothetical protein